MLGLQARAGRLLGPEDDRTPGAHPVAVLAYGYWQRKFGGDKNILQNTIQMNGHPLTVIGIAPPGFQGVEVGGATDVFVPVMMKKQATPTWDGMEDRRDAWLQVFARLKPGITPQQAQASLEPLYKQILNAEVDTLPADKPLIREAFLKEKKLLVDEAGKGISNLRRSAEKPLYVLMAMVGLVLLIACANVANLLTARAAARQKEIAIRISLGASQWQIARQLLVESAVLSLIGGCLALLVAVWTGDLLISFLPFEEAPRAFTTAPDARVLVFNFAIRRCCGSAVRTCSGDSGYSQGYRRYAEGGSRQYVERQRPGSTPERACCCPDLLVADAADRRGIVCAQSLQSQDACIRASLRRT